MDNLSLTEAIVNILENSSDQSAPGTQAELMDCLKEQKLKVNQSSVSRALKKLGAIKEINTIGKQVYVLPTKERQQKLYSQELIQLARYINFIDSNETVSLIKTGPGSAQLVCAILDQLKNPLIMGTIAGDDTIIIYPKSIHQLKELHKFLESLL